MAHSKATVALDRQKVAAAMALTDQGSMSKVIDLALTRLISSEQTRRDIAAYARQPQDEEKITLARHPVTIDLDDDDVDYVALYGRDG